MRPRKAKTPPGAEFRGGNAAQYQNRLRSLPLCVWGTAKPLTLPTHTDLFFLLRRLVIWWVKIQVSASSAVFLPAFPLSNTFTSANSCLTALSRRGVNSLDIRSTSAWQISRQLAFIIFTEWKIRTYMLVLSMHALKCYALSFEEL